ncbi:MAG: hypothetical protein ACE5NC_04505 [Anaerolineae bacterium]
MLIEPFVAQRMAQQRMIDSERDAEHVRLIRSVEGSRRQPSWQLAMGVVFSSLLTFLGRSAS